MYNKLHKYHVYLNDKLIDIVFYQNCIKEEVKKSLIEHDGYNPNIKVFKYILG